MSKEVMFLLSCSWKESKFLRAASFANARKVNVSEFQVKNLGQSETPTSKTDLLIFQEQSTLGFLST